MELVLSEGVLVTGVALLEVLVELPSVLAGVLMVRLYPAGNTSVGIQLYESTPGRWMTSGGLRTGVSCLMKIITRPFSNLESGIFCLWTLTSLTPGNLKKIRRIVSLLVVGSTLSIFKVVSLITVEVRRVVKVSSEPHISKSICLFTYMFANLRSSKTQR